MAYAAVARTGLAPAAWQRRWLWFVVSARVGLAAAVAAAGSFTTGLTPLAEAVFYVVQFGWLPVAALVAYAAQHENNRFARYAGPLSDLAVAVVVVVAYPQLALVAIVAAGIVSAETLVWWPELPATAGPVLAFVAAAAAISAHGWSASTALAVLATAIVVGAVALVGSATVKRERAAAQSRTALLQRADTITAAVPHPILVTDEQAQLRSWNPAAARLLPPEVGVGASCAQALGLHAGERPLDCSSGCALLALTGEGDAVEVWQPRPGGGEGRRPLLASAAVIPTAEVGAREVVHSLRDISALKQADEAKTLFLATASHELKTPLTVIRGFSDMLLRNPDFDVERRQMALEAIDRRARDLNAIVDRILLSSRIEAGRLSLTNAEIDPASIVGDRVTALAAAAARDVRFTSVDATVAAWGNVSALTTVIDHLLDNAVKYSPADSPIDVTVTADEEVVRIVVADHGLGMDEEQMRHCFDKFWQADSTDSRQHGGTGIGLYIVRSLVEAMLGDIAVTSGMGSGTAFTVTLRGAEAALVPAQRSAEELDDVEHEPSMVREFMRQLGLPTGGHG